MSKQKNVRATLVGGIGNQLFIYALAKSVADQINGKLELDLRGIPLRGQQAKSSILDFDLARDRVITPFRPSTIWHRPFSLRAFDTEKLTPIASWIVGKTPIESMRELDTTKNKFVVAEWGQTTDIASTMRRGIRPKLLRETTSFQKWKKDLEESSIAIHHRLGDAVKLRDTRGQLGARYFAESLDRIRGKFGRKHKIVVFSDEIKESQKLFSSWGLVDANFIWAPPTFSAAEVLMLITYADWQISSNSTLSFWSGHFSRTGNVIAPNEWEVGKSNHLVYDDWSLTPSHWM